MAVGPARISLISPPQHGRMGKWGSRHAHPRSACRPSHSPWKGTLDQTHQNPPMSMMSFNNVSVGVTYSPKWCGCWAHYGTWAWWASPETDPSKPAMDRPCFGDVHLLWAWNKMVSSPGLPRRLLEWLMGLGDECLCHQQAWTPPYGGLGGPLA